MVVIFSAAFATNKIANHYIFNHSDVVPAIGAFTAGNLYSSKIGGTAFTFMVTGVLFLVPVSQRFSIFVVCLVSPRQQVTVAVSTLGVPCQQWPSVVLLVFS